MGTMMWGGRFSDGPDEILRRFNDSLGFDVRLLPWDVVGSMAHAAMLAEVGILEVGERDALLAGLREIGEAGPEGLPPAEDVHSAVEAALYERVGRVAGKLHAGRSRNDQVAADVRLYLRARCLDLAETCLALAGTLLRRAREHRDDPMPGYTHLQRAQVITIGHHLAAYVEMLLRDAARHIEVHDGNMLCPLGSGALAGSSLPLDRRRTADLLGFDGITMNSLDAVSDRDGVAAALFAATLTMVHLSRLAEEMTLWMSGEFAVLRLPDRYCTGSSLMPHKKNPDVPELIRGRAGRAVGDLVALLTMLKGLPLAYNKDLQEDKEALFDAQDAAGDALVILERIWDAARFDCARARTLAERGNLSATALAELLVRRGLPFREAHHRVGAAVQRADAAGETLESLPGEALEDALGVEGIPAEIRTARGLAAGQITAGAPGPEPMREALGDMGRRRRALSRKLASRRARLPSPETISAPPGLNEDRRQQIDSDEDSS